MTKVVIKFSKKRIAAVFTVLIIIFIFGHNPSAALNAELLPPPSEKTRAEYKLTILPANRTVFIEATIRGAEKSEIKSWVAGVGGLNAQILSSNAGEIKFAYTVAVPEKERLNSPDAYLDKNRFRAWGWNIFIFPLLDKPSGEVALTIDAPEEWSGRATSFGVNHKRFVLPNLNALLDMAVAAGDFRTSEFSAGGVPVYLAVRKEHAVSDEVFKEALKRLIEAGARYTGAKLPERVFFAVDLLGERKTYAPGNHVRGGAHGSTIMIDRDNADPRQPQFWGTYSHEFTHTWIPAVFGNSALTQKELGSFFTEGFTDYLAYRITHSAGIHTDDQFARALSKFYLEYADVAGSVENEQDAEFLRYRQGMMAAWMLDVELLRRSKGKRGFREFIRLLVGKYENSGGLTKEKFISALTELGGKETAALFEKLRDAEKKIDFSAILKDTGIKIEPVQNAREALKIFNAGKIQPVTFEPATRGQKMFLRWFLSREN